MKTKNILWIIEILITIIYFMFSLFVYTSCDIQGFAIADQYGLLKQLAFSCKNSLPISYTFAGIILFFSILIIYLNLKKIDK